MEEIKSSGINDDHIIYIDFESLDYAFITNATELNNYIKKLVKDKNDYYVFLDEVQKVDNFEKAINCLRITDQFSIFAENSLVLVSKIYWRILLNDVTSNIHRLLKILYIMN